MGQNIYTEGKFELCLYIRLFLPILQEASAAFFNTTMWQVSIKFVIGDYSLSCKYHIFFCWFSTALAMFNLDCDFIILRKIHHKKLLQIVKYRRR
jgi:hypothetical protein